MNYVFAVLFLDLDRFKINDSLGHIFGSTANCDPQRLKACMRSGDTVARFGEMSLYFLSDITDVSDATYVTERIQKELALPLM